MASIPHLQYPFEFVSVPGGTKAAAVTEQDSIEEISQCVNVILLYGEGQRPEAYYFGVREQLFALNIDTAYLVEAIRRSETRVDVAAAASIDAIDNLVQSALVTIKEAQ